MKMYAVCIHGKKNKQHTAMNLRLERDEKRK